MPKKKRAASNSAAAKKRRQAQQQARIAETKATETLAKWEAAFQQSIDAGRFRVRAADGQVKELTLERIRAHMEADLAADGEPPLGGQEHLIELLWEEFLHGWAELHDDGTWTFDEDYFTDVEAPR